MVRADPFIRRIPGAVFYPVADVQAQGIYKDLKYFFIMKKSRIINSYIKLY